MGGSALLAAEEHMLGLTTLRIEVKSPQRRQPPQSMTCGGVPGELI